MGSDPRAGRGGTLTGQDTGSALRVAAAAALLSTARLFVCLSLNSHLLPIFKTFLLILTGFYLLKNRSFSWHMFSV